MGMMQNVAQRRRRLGDLRGCTGARRPQRRGHGDRESSVVRGNCYNKKLLCSGRPRYCHATAIKGPCGRRSTRYWRRHYLDHPATFQTTTLRLSSARKVNSIRATTATAVAPVLNIHTSTSRLSLFERVTTDKVRCILRTVPAKDCSLDPARLG